MSSQLPVALAAAMEALLERVSRKELAVRSQALSAAYRKTGAADLRDRLDAIAYAVARMPATYAALSAALRWTAARLGDWRPHSLLDLGSGPGTAIWAVHETYQTLQTVFAVERSAIMSGLAEEIGSPIVMTNRLKFDLASRDHTIPKSDLVVAAYVLGELGPGNRQEFLDRAWTATKDVLLIVEPGTPAGAAAIARARQHLLAANGHPVAPCTHALACPLPAPGWCHFPARVARSRAHMQLKTAVVPFEDEKFSYLAVGRQKPINSSVGRVVGPLEMTKPSLKFDVCQEGQIARLQIPRRDAAEFRRVRKLGWGDLI